MQSGHRVARFPCSHGLALLTLLREQTTFAGAVTCLTVALFATARAGVPVMLAFLPICATTRLVTGYAAEVFFNRVEYTLNPGAFSELFFAFGKLARETLAAAGAGVTEMLALVETRAADPRELEEGDDSEETAAGLAAILGEGRDSAAPMMVQIQMRHCCRTALHI